MLAAMLMRLVLMAFLLAFAPLGARADDALPAPADDEEEISASAPVAEPVTVQQQEDAARKAEESDESKNPMNWLGLGVKVGFGRIRSSNLKNPTYRKDIAEAAAMADPAQLEMYGLTGGGACTVISERCTTPGRFGLYIALALSIGGDGFGWDIEPYLQSAAGAKAYGIYTGPKFDIHVFDRFYVGFGFGLKGAIISSKAWDYGADLYGRIPLRGTLYLFPNLALVGEFAFGAGASGFSSKPTTITDPTTGLSIRTSPSLTFGAGRTWDASIGVRFP
jgi:hypothetical protein